MTLLKDIRLLLIIGLAILCLLALRLCSSEYQPQTAARDGTLVNSGQTDVAENATEETQQEETQQSESTAETETQGIVSNQQASDESTVVTDENTATDAGSDEAESKADEAEAEDTKDDSAEATGTSDTDSATETEATSTETETEETAAAEESATEDAATTNTEATQNSQDSAAVAATTEYEVVPSTIEADGGAGAEVVSIVIRERSADGDLQTDIDTIQDGLDQYGEKLGVVKTLIESLSK